MRENSTTTTYFYIPDIQGSIRAMVDRDGNAVATYTYGAWGSLISYSGDLAQKNDYLYRGRSSIRHAGFPSTIESTYLSSKNSNNKIPRRRLTI